MIIDEIYNLEDYCYSNENVYMSLRDYNLRYVNRIIALTVKNFDINAIVVGIDLYGLISEYNSFYHFYNTNINNIIQLVGSLRGINLYVDFRLKNNQVVIGNSMTEVKNYIITKLRKNKLKKIQENI